MLVAVDDIASGWEPLEWATAEAAARRSALRIVHAITWPLLRVDAFGLPFANQLGGGEAEVAELVVSQAANHARVIAPEVEVTTHLQAGPTSAAVLREAHQDALIVLGRERLARRRGSFTRSATWSVARHASCPVAVVDLLNQPSPGPSTGRVVVMVDGAEEPTAALGFAFRSAQRRGVGVTALRTSMPPIPDDLEARIPDPAAAEPLGGRTVEDALRRCRAAFPEVDVRQQLVATPAGQALVAESTGAALVVLSSRAHRRTRRALLGAAERTVLRSTHSPVAIVTTSRTGARLARG